jgi:hypothetical protein
MPTICVPAWSSPFIPTEVRDPLYCDGFHVAEHESHHDGQIKFLKHRLPGAKDTVVTEEGFSATNCAKWPTSVGSQCRDPVYG